MKYTEKFINTIIINIKHVRFTERHKGGCNWFNLNNLSRISLESLYGYTFVPQYNHLRSPISINIKLVDIIF